MLRFSDVQCMLTAYQADGYLSLCGVEDEPVPVHGYQDDGEGGEEDTCGL